MSLADVDEDTNAQVPTRRLLYVGGLSIDITEDMIRTAFVPFGELVDVNLPEVPPQHTVEKTRRFAFVEYEDPVDALHAKENMHDSELGGRIIVVKYADERRSHEKARAVWAQLPLENEEGRDDGIDIDPSLHDNDAAAIAAATDDH